MSKTKKKEMSQEERVDDIREAWAYSRKSLTKVMTVYEEVMAITDRERDNIEHIMLTNWAGTFGEHSPINGGIFIKYGYLDSEIEFKVYDHTLFNFVVKEIRQIINRTADSLGQTQPRKVTWNMNNCTRCSDELALACFSIEVEDERWKSTYSSPTWVKCYQINVYFDPDKPPAFMTKDAENPDKCGWSTTIQKSYMPAPQWECHA